MLERRLDVLKTRKFLRGGGVMLNDLDVYWRRQGNPIDKIEDWMYMLEFDEVKI